MGSALNFLSNTSVPDGEVRGCLTPAGATGVLYHAKPVIIWGGYIAARATGNFTPFKAFSNQMEALLTYWNSSSRYDARTGLWHWHDQLESGCDNLVLSECPSQFSPECWSEDIAFSLASPDLQVFMYREYKAFSLFQRQWANEATARGDADAAALARDADAGEARFRAVGAGIRAAVNDYLWHWENELAGVGWWAAWNRTTSAQIRNRTFQMALPLWEDLYVNVSQVEAAVRAVTAGDMLGPWGVNSVSNQDPRYNNDNIIDPYSNWRGAPLTGEGRGRGELGGEHGSSGGPTSTPSPTHHHRQPRMPLPTPHDAPHPPTPQAHSGSTSTRSSP